MSKSSDARKELESMKLALSELGQVVDDIDVRKQTLEAMAGPILAEAKRNAGRSGLFKAPTGNMARSIATEWTMLDSETISIGFTAKGFYGAFYERGFLRYAKTKARTFVKIPILRPAYTKAKLQSAEAGMKTLRRYFERIK